MVPVKLAMALAEIAVLPEAPGEVMVKLEGVAVKLKSALPPEIAMESGVVVVELE